MKQRIKHTISTISTYKGEQLPIIIIPDKHPYYSNIALYYLKVLKNREVSLSALKKLAPSLTYLFDYYIEHKPKNIKEQRIFLENYTKSLKLGNTLNWDIHSIDRRQKIFYNTKQFIEFALQHKHLANEKELPLINTLFEAFNFSKNIPDSKFLKKFLIYKERLNNNILKAFPANKLMSLIEAQEDKYKILYILQAFGGINATKALHLLKEDVRIENNRLKITIAHPENSLINGVKRSEYLKALGYKPRTKEIKKDYVGWRNPRYQYPNQLKSEIIFIGEIENYLIDIHKSYINSREDNNPFYFIGENSALRYHKIREKFKKDCKKLNITEDYSLNSLRYFYGYYTTRVLKLDELFTQRLMGYTDVEKARRYAIDKTQDYKAIARIQDDRRYIE